jgi:hypothetical protein
MSSNTTRDLTQNGPTALDVVQAHMIESLLYVCYKQLIISNITSPYLGYFLYQNSIPKDNIKENFYNSDIYYTIQHFCITSNI